MRLSVRLAPLGARQKPPAMRVRVEGYTKKTPNAIRIKVFQANCKAKGEKYGTKGS